VDRLSLTLFGGFQARLGAEPALTFPTRKAQALLAYLALPPGRSHPREKLATLLWGGMREPQARKGLRQALFTLRKVTRSAAIVLDAATVTLDLTAVAIDVNEFERCVADGTPAALERAAALYRGELLEGIAAQEAPFEEWLLAERERLRELALEALAKLLAHQRDAASTGAAAQTAVRLLGIDPLQESVHRVLMRLYLDSGRRPAALRQYQLCVSALQRELGVEPEAETKRLYHDILRQRSSRAAPAVDARTTPTAPPESLPRDGPLIGRDAELERLRALLAEAGAGRGHVAAVIGEAGVGKSRLVAEVAADVAARGGRLLLGRCYDAEQILSFGPWVDALRGGRIDAETDVLINLNSLRRAALARLLPESAPAGHDPGLAPDDVRQVFESVAQVLHSLAARQPLLVILEDVHWADEMSLRLVSFLGRRLKACPILVMVTAREEDLESVPMLRRTLDDLARDHHLVDVRLAPLSRVDTLALVRTLAGTQSDVAAITRLVEQVWTASEGNPFVTIEMMRACSQAAESPPSALTLTQSVHAIVMRHLDTLSPRARELAAVAAVIGREFEFTLLSRAAGLDDVETAEVLEELVRRRVVGSRDERFDFTHDRIREVAYGTLLTERRRALHARIVEAIESVYRDRLDDHVERLGDHASRGEVWDKAVTYLRLAGAKAVTCSANVEAARCLERALAALEHVPARRETQEIGIDIRYELDSPLMALGAYDRRLERFREAEALAATLGDRKRLVRALAWGIQNFPFLGRTRDAMRMAQRCLELARGIDDPMLELVVRQTVGRAEWEAGAYAEAVARLRQNVGTLALELDRPHPGTLRPVRAAVISRYWLVLCLAELGEFDEGSALAEEALQFSERWDHPWSRALSYRIIAAVALRRGDLEGALPAAARSLELCTTNEVPYMFPALASLYGYVLALSGRIGDGVALMERAQAVARETAAESAEPMRRAQLGEGYLLAGRPEAARDLAVEAFELAEERGEQGYAAWARRLLAEIAGVAPSLTPETAEDHYRDALTRANALGMRPLAAHCHLGLGGVYSRAGKRSEATEHLAAAATTFRVLGMRRGLLQAKEDAISDRATRP
jgi:DNA-binding SARP family transcriptional activator